MVSLTMMEIFSTPDNPSLLHYGTYTPSLVILSILVAIFSSWMGLQVAAQARLGGTRGLRAAMLATGSLALGCGVWSMHFIGMLAFDLCIDVDYDHGLTLLSVLPSLAASWVALTIISRRRVTRLSLMVGGVLVGAGIGAMHYTGMAAMQMALAQRYDPFMFGLSIVVAVVLATLALWIRFGLRTLRLPRAVLGVISASVMGCAIAGMHYTGMAAARFVGTCRWTPRRNQFHLPGAGHHADYRGVHRVRDGGQRLAALPRYVPPAGREPGLDARAADHHHRRRHHRRPHRRDPRIQSVGGTHLRLDPR
jgi:NO-binding membrane sensor protein with MHYT domain